MPTSPGFSDRPHIAPYNFIDLEAKATDYLARVRAEAIVMMTQVRDEILRLRTRAESELAAVRTEAEQTRAASLELETLRTRTEQEARTKGYNEGQQQGYHDGELHAQTDYADKVQREAERQLASHLETLLPAVRTMVERLDVAREGFLAEWEKSAIHVATTIAHRAIERQLPEMIDLPLDLLREALALGVGGGQLKIRMNPHDHDTLRPQAEIIVREITHVAECEIISDPKVSLGGCMIETSLGSVDQRIESRLSRIKSELV